MRRFPVIPLVPVLATLLAMLLATLLSFAAAQTRWTMHVAWPETNFHTQGVLDLAERVEAATDGGLVIDVNAGGSLGFQGQEILRVVRDGTLPIAEVLMGNLQGDEAIFGLTSLPLLVGDYDEARALYEAARPAYEAALERHGQLLLYAAPWPPSGIYTKEPLASPDDLQGLKMRTYDANSASFAEGLGAQGLAIPFSELYTALSTGLINSVLTSSQTGVDASLWEVTDHFTRINYAFPLNMVTVNRRAFEALPEEQQRALREAAAAVEEVQWQRSAEADDASAATLAEQGMTVSAEVSPELQTAMEEVAARLEQEWLEFAGDAGRQALDAFGR